MRRYNDDLTLLEIIQDILSEDKVCLMTESELEFEVFNSICSEENKTKWVNSSGKGDPPPDFYSDDFKMMFDIMMVDDTGYKTTGGRYINRQKQAESKVYKVIKNSGILKNFTNLEHLFININSGESTTEHHSFARYKSEFKRIIEKHLESVSLYRKNHPNYKLGFMIYDESEPYCELNVSLYNVEEFKKKGILPPAEIHIPFLDESFISLFKGKDVDFIFWYMNNKKCRGIRIEDGSKIEEIDLPMAVILDLKNIDKIKLLKYKDNNMVSVNE